MRGRPNHILLATFIIVPDTSISVKGFACLSIGNTPFAVPKMVFSIPAGPAKGNFASKVAMGHFPSTWVPGLIETNAIRYNHQQREKNWSTDQMPGWTTAVDIFDRHGWNCFTYTFSHWGGIQKRSNGQIIIRFDSADAQAINDDILFEHYREVMLCSNDNGKHGASIPPHGVVTFPIISQCNFQTGHSSTWCNDAD